MSRPVGCHHFVQITSRLSRLNVAVFIIVFLDLRFTRLSIILFFPFIGSPVISCKHSTFDIFVVLFDFADLKMILLLHFTDAKRHGTPRLASSPENLGGAQTHLLTVMLAQFSTMKLLEQVLGYFEIVLLEILVLNGIQHVLIGPHFLFDGVERDLVQYRINHLKHAFVTKLILIP